MSHLFDPIEINGLSLENKIVMPPMARDKSTKNGKPKKELIDYYEKRASGVGLVIVEHAYVEKRGKLSKNQLGIHKDELIPELEKIVETIHEKNSPTILQLNHAGAVAKKEIIGKRPLAPSRVNYTEEIPKILELKEIQQIKESFVQAAERAEKAGFDGIEVHGAHGFLLNQFMSPITNNRMDVYGGNQENRIRLPLQIVREIKDKNSDLDLFFRLGADDRRPGGIDREKGKYIASKLENAGVDVLDISGGLCGSNPKDLSNKQGFFVPLASEMKKVVKIPVIGVGGITNPEYAEDVIKSGKVDLVAIGRELIRNPNWSEKAKKSLSKE